MENTEKKGNGLATTGVTLGSVALGIAAFQNGGLNGILGGNRQPAEPLATKAEVGYERQLTEKDMEIAQLKAEKYADAAALAVERRVTDKIEELKNQQTAVNAAQLEINTRQSDLIGQMRGQIGYLESMTAPYIKQPIMAASEAAYNAFKSASTTTAATSGN